MQIGMVGLGRMGANMARRLKRGGHDCVVFDLNPDNVQRLAAEGFQSAASLKDFVAKLQAPRAVWIMVPAGEPTEETIYDLQALLDDGDVIIDGGNSYYKDDVRRARMLKKKGVLLLDAGTSGGIWGLDRGYCLMVGGDSQAFQRLEPVFKTLSPGRGDIPRTPGRESIGGTAEQGYLYCGPTGAGHFTKMIHNGIEYGLMQAYAEGFDILKHADAEGLDEGCRYTLPVADIAELWRRGSVVGSWLLDLTAMALTEQPDLAKYTGYVQDSGEGRWTIMAAIEEAVPAAVLSDSLYARFRSRKERTFGDKLLSAMRQKFGGHVELPSGG